MPNNLSALPKKRFNIFNDENVLKGYKDGIELDKGTVLNEDFLNEHYEEICKIGNEWAAYPDVFLDIIKPVEENFTLFFYQRILLRSILRFKEVFVTAPRAAAKSFITILGIFLECVFIPKTKRFICAPNKNQSAQIAKEKIIEIYDKWPLLRKEVIGGMVSDTPGNFGKDYVKQK